MKKYRATFHPQAWQNDYAIPVDAKGLTEWDVTPEYLAGLIAKADTSAEHAEAWYTEADNYGSDELRFDPAAPQWCRDWDGPFFVSVVEVGDA